MEDDDVVVGEQRLRRCGQSDCCTAHDKHYHFVYGDGYGALLLLYEELTV